MSRCERSGENADGTRKGLARWTSMAITVLIAVLIFLLTDQSTSESAKLTMVTSDMIMQAVEEISPSSITYYANGLGFYPQGIKVVPLGFSIGYRQLAHAIEFFILGISMTITVVLWLFEAGIQKKASLKAALLSTAICFAYSILDQTHRLVVPGREFDAFDLILDAIGYCCAILLASILYYIKERTLMNRMRAMDSSTNN